MGQATGEITDEPESPILEIGTFEEQFPDGEVGHEYGQITVTVEEVAGVETDGLEVQLTLVVYALGDGAVLFDETIDDRELQGESDTFAFDVGSLDVPGSYEAYVTVRDDTDDDTDDVYRSVTFEVEADVEAQPSGTIELEDPIVEDQTEFTVAYAFENTTDENATILAGREDAQLEDVVVATVETGGSLAIDVEDVGGISANDEIVAMIWDSNPLEGDGSVRSSVDGTAESEYEEPRVEFEPLDTDTVTVSARDGTNLNVTEVTLDRNEVQTGESVTVTAVVETGEVGHHVVGLEVDGDVVDTETVGSDDVPEVETEVEFTHAFEKAGTFAVSIDGVDAGTVTVLESADVTIFGASVNQSRLLVDEPAAISANLYNSGDVSGDVTVELRIEGERVGDVPLENETIAADPGISRDAVAFEWTPTASQLPEGENSDNVTIRLNDLIVETLPLENQYSDVQVIAASASKVEVVQGESFHVVGSIYQAGTIDGPEDVSLNATHQDGGETHRLNVSEDVGLAPGFYHLGAINLSASFDEELGPGTYDLELGDRSAGEIEVIEAYSDVQVIAASASQDEIVQGETFHVVGSIYQAGTIDGPEDVSLNATHQDGGETHRLNVSEDVELAPGFYYLGAINLSASFDEKLESGTYDLELGDRSAGEIEVIEAYSDVQVIAASASQSEVVQGESFHVVGSIYQAGTVDGPEDVSLNATHQDDGETHRLNVSEGVELSPGFYHLGAINLSASFDDTLEPGAYDLTLGDHDVGEIEVIAAESDIQVVAASASQSEIVQGEPFHVVGSIYQAGTIDGPEDVSLNATHQDGGETHRLNVSEDVELAPGFYHLGAINLSASFDDTLEPGTYDLELGDRTAGEIEVIEAYSDVQVIAASASQSEVVQDESFHVVGSIFQAGTIDGPEDVSLNATHQDGEEVVLTTSDEVSLQPGFYHLGAINLSASFDPAEVESGDPKPGTYDLSLGDRGVGEIEVVEAYSDVQVIAGSLSEMNVTRGESIYVTGSIYQAGTVAGPEDIALNVSPTDSEEVHTLNVSTGVELEPGFYHLGAVNLSAEFDSDRFDAGTYDVTLGDHEIGTIGVEESPSDIRVIAASVSEIEVLEGEELYVTGSIYQNGTANGGGSFSEDIPLTATLENGDGEPIELGVAEDVELAPGFYHLGAINISFVIDDPGTYTLTLGDHDVGEIEVVAAESDIRVIAASASQSEVVQGESFHVVGSIYQAGTIDGPEDVSLDATRQGTNETVTLNVSEDVELAPGFYHLGAINLSASFDEELGPGTYDLELGDRSAGEIEVIEAYSDVQVIAASASQDEVVQGESFHVVGSIYQAGTIDGPEDVALTATLENGDGEPIELGVAEDVELAPGFYHLGAINISFAIDDPGTYTLTLGDHDVGEIEVVAAESDIRVIAASASQSEVVQGESFHVVGSIYQAGTVDGPEDVSLNATHQDGGETHRLNVSEGVELSPGFYHLGAINLSASFDDILEPGTYDLILGDRDAGEIEVVAAESDIRVIAASVSQDEVVEGEPFHVVGSIYQAGTIDGPEDVALTATRQGSDETVTLNASEDRTLRPNVYHLGAINLSATFETGQAGSYDLFLGETPAGTLTVGEPSVEITAVDVRGRSSGLDSGLEYANETAAVEVAVESDLPVQDVSVFVDSLETNYLVEVDAGREAGDAWSASVPLEELPDDGAYAISALALDESDTAGSLEADRTLVIDREEPSLAVSIEDVTGDDATVVVESDEPLAGVPEVKATFTGDGGSSESAAVTMDPAGAGATTYTGTIEFDESGNYSVTATATDLAGNVGEDDASAVVYTGFSLADETITIEETGTTIDFHVADQAVTSDDLFLAFSESAVNANLDSGELGVGFLSAELDDLVDSWFEDGTVEGATISMPIDEGELADGYAADDVGFYHYDEQDASWDPVESTVTGPATDPTLVADVYGFSTYGAIVIDDEPPTITADAPVDGQTFDAGTETVQLRLEYDDPRSGIDVGSVRLEVDGDDRTHHENTSITSSAVEHAFAVEDGSDYDVRLWVSDEAGNEATHAVAFEIDEDATGSSGGSPSGSAGGQTPPTDDETATGGGETPESDDGTGIVDGGETSPTDDGGASGSVDETVTDDGGEATASDEATTETVGESDTVPGFGAGMAALAVLFGVVVLTRRSGIRR
ncbi:hypothetical protein [Natrarchaeobius oligotrophus]|uniref:hypothetical protein n=1 Tax=Natrarchaeobius oligotrophus TaxID=3455743 RepID=UPI000F538838|nr:hypothetical protein [Natrarchaeobius chitinivorans]